MKSMKFGDMTISQIKEICDDNLCYVGCSTCPLRLHIKEGSSGLCVFNTPPWEWVVENPVKIPEQKGENK